MKSYTEVIAELDEIIAEIRPPRGTTGDFGAEHLRLLADEIRRLRALPTPFLATREYDEGWNDVLSRMLDEVGPTSSLTPYLQSLIKEPQNGSTQAQDEK